MNRSLNWMSWGFQVWLPLVSCPAGLLCRCAAATERTPGWPRVSNAHQRFVSWATWLRRGPRLQSDASTRHGLQPEVLLLGLRRALPAHAYCGGPGPRAALDAGCDAPEAEREAVMDALDRVVWVGESRVRAVGVRVGRGDREGRRGASAAALFICMSSVPLI